MGNRTVFTEELHPIKKTIEEIKAKLEQMQGYDHQREGKFDTLKKQASELQIANINQI